MDTRPWVSRSSPGKQLLLSVGCAFVGLVLLVAARHGGPSANATAGMWLGALLLVIGVAGALGSGTQTITVDPRQRRIVIEDRHLMGTTTIAVPFNDIARVGIGYLGTPSDGVTMYHIELHLRRGGTRPLFAPGRFYAGASDRSVVEGWQQRIERLIAQARP